MKVKGHHDQLSGSRLLSLHSHFWKKNGRGNISWLIYGDANNIVNVGDLEIVFIRRLHDILSNINKLEFAIVVQNLYQWSLHMIE